MRFSNTIAVAAEPDELFRLLSDVERVAGCLPGAVVEGKDGDDYMGSMRVRVGPVTASYRGTLRFRELDPIARRAVMSARAAETNGSGGAQAQVVTAVEPGDGSESRITLETDLQLRGRLAQFGRGAIERVSGQLMDQFARNLERVLTDGGAKEPAPARASGEGDAAAGRPAPAGWAAPRAGAGEPLDLLGTAISPRLRGWGPVLLAAALGALYGYLVGRLRSERA